MSEAVFGSSAILFPTQIQSEQTIKYEEIIRLQIDTSALKVKMKYMGTKADLQELRADFNKSMRDFQTECNGRFERLDSKLQNILITMWVAIVGAFLTSIGIMASIIFGFPWEKFFAFKTWLEATF